MIRIEKSSTGLRWIKDSWLHRIDKPAFILFSGTKAWYKNGKLYREDGPAIEWADT